MIFQNKDRAMEIKVEFHTKAKFEYREEVKAVIEFLSKIQKEHDGEIHCTLSVVVE